MAVFPAPMVGDKTLGPRALAGATWRNSIRLRRNSASLVSALVIPGMPMLAFWVVFGHAASFSGFDCALFLTAASMFQAVMFTAGGSAMALAVDVESGLLIRWLRSPAGILFTLGMPAVMMVILNVMFSGMVEQFNGTPMDMTGVCVVVAVSQSFTAALMGAGNIALERQDGLPDRLTTLPGHRSSTMIGRILAESVKSFVSVLAALAIGFVFGADPPAAAGLFRALVVLAAVAAGSVGVMLGFVVDTPQGAVSFAPLVMAAMFFNTAMMPREMYAEVSRPVVDFSPVTAVTGLVDSPVAGSFVAGDAVLLSIWFGGLVVLSVVVLAHKAIGPRR